MTRHVKDITLEEIEEYIKLFLDNKTYTFLKVKHLDEEFFYNGYILENNSESILFKDDISGDLPILKNKILRIEVSKRDKNE